MFNLFKSKAEKPKVDMLTKLYNDYAPKADGSSFQAFQAGFTASAQSMRKRAMDACKGKKDINDIINAIGSLSDIPTE